MKQKIIEYLLELSEHYQIAGTDKSRKELEKLIYQLSSKNKYDTIRNL